MFLISVLKNFANFTEKTPVLMSLFKNVTDPQAQVISTQALSCIICKILKSTFFTEHQWWLLVKISNSSNLFKDFSAISVTPNKSLITCNSHNDKLFPIDRFCNSFTINSKEYGLNIKNFAIVLHF